MKTRGKIILGIGMGFLTVFTVTLNVLCLTFLDPVLTQFFGSADASIDGGTTSSELDLEYYKKPYKSVQDFEKAQIDLAERVAEEGIMLLKNDNNALPLSKSTTVDVWGYESYNYIYSGTGSGGNGAAGNQQNLRDGLVGAGLKINEKLWNYYVNSNYSVTGYKGKTYQANKHNDNTYGKGGTGLGSVNYASDLDYTIFDVPYDRVKNDVGDFNQNTAIYTLGRLGGESADVARYMTRWVTSDTLDREGDSKRHYLQPNSQELNTLKKLSETYNNLVVIINSGCAMELDEVAQYADAIVWAPALGSNGTTGLGRLLSGDRNFSGKLPDTISKDNRNAPANQNFGDFYYDNFPYPNGRKVNYISYLEGIYVGYKYYETRYTDMVLNQGNAANADAYNKNGFKYVDQVQYPFGHGLSYTNFEWSNFSIEKDGDEFTAKVTVKNTGARSGKDVVELYVQSPYKTGGVEKAAVNLIGFAKTKELKANETETVEIKFAEIDLKSYDYKTEKTYVLDAGDYYFTAAKDAHQAANNILTSRGKTVADGMDKAGDATMVNKQTLAAKKFNKSEVGENVEITNQLDHADGGFTYLSRSNWSGTYPKPNGTRSSNNNDSSFGDYKYHMTASAALQKKIKSYDSLNPNQPREGNSNPGKLPDLRDRVYNCESELELIDLRGMDFNSPLWDELLDRLTFDEISELVTKSGFRTMGIKSIQKPLTSESDGPNGWSSVVGGAGARNTVVYPCEVVFGGTFNSDIALEFGEMLGVSALYFGKAGIYAPGMNMHRSCFGGRNYEYYSEDSFLTGVMGGRVCYGSSSKGMYTMMKHFALNEQDEMRSRSGGLVTWCNEQAAREIYLKPFEMACKNETVETKYYQLQQNGTYVEKTAQTPGCMGMMTSFNRVGTTWAGGDYNLLTNIVRKEWGFNGLIITDYIEEISYMNPQQMAYAGGDCQLNNAGFPGNYKTETNLVNYYYGRLCAKRILYTVANSKVMNGLIHGAVVAEGFANYKYILIAWNTLTIGLLAGGAVLLLLKGKKKEEIQN